MKDNENQDSGQTEVLTPEDLSASEKTQAQSDSKNEQASVTSSKASADLSEKIKIAKEKLAAFLSLAWLKLNELLDLKDIEHRLPPAIREKLPENKRLVTLPIFFLVLGIFLMFMLAFFAPQAKKQTRLNDIPAVRVVSAQKESLQIPVYSQGLVEPEKEIKFISLVNGQITYISPNFVEGGVVKEGELMLQVSDRSYQQDKAKADANLARAKAAQFAKQSELRVQGTLRSGGGQAQLIEVNAAVDAAQADVQRVEDLIESTKFIAPFSGLLRGVTVQAGQSVRAGVPIASVFSKHKAIVNVSLSDRQLSLLDLTKLNRHIESEQPIADASKEMQSTTDTQQSAEQADEQKALDDDLPDVKVKGKFGDRVFYWKGKVIRSAGARNEINRMYYVTVEINEPFETDPEQPGRPPLMPGFYVELEIEGRKLDQIVKLPRSALKANQKVWTVNEKNILESHDVDLFYRGKDFIYVSSGIENSDQVVVSNLEVMADGMEVKLANVQEMVDDSNKQSAQPVEPLEIHENTEVMQKEGVSE